MTVVTAVGNSRDVLEKFLAPILDDMGVSITIDGVPDPNSVGIVDDGRVSALAFLSTSDETRDLCPNEARDKTFKEGIWREDESLPFPVKLVSRQAFLDGLKVWSSLPGRVFASKVVVKIREGLFMCLVPAPNKTEQTGKPIRDRDQDDDMFQDYMSAALGY